MRRTRRAFGGCRPAGPRQGQRHLSGRPGRLDSRPAGRPAPLGVRDHWRHPGGGTRLPWLVGRACRRRPLLDECFDRSSQSRLRDVPVVCTDGFPDAIEAVSPTAGSPDLRPGSRPPEPTLPVLPPQSLRRRQQTVVHRKRVHSPSLLAAVPADRTGRCARCARGIALPDRIERLLGRGGMGVVYPAEKGCARRGLKCQTLCETRGDARADCSTR